MRKFIKYSFLIGSILFAVLLIFCRTIPNLNPYEQSFSGILGLAVPFLALANIGFLIWWLLFKKYFYTAIPFFALVFSWKIYSVTIASHVLKKQQFENSDSSFTVMSYNVRLLDLYKWSGNPDTRNKMIDFFAEQNPTVLCLQEFYTGNDSVGKDNIKDIIDKCHFKYYASCDINVNKRGRWGSVLFSHLPIVKKQNHDIDVYGSNMLQQVDVLFRKDTISVYNIHLKSNRFTTEESDLIVKNEEVGLDEKTSDKTKRIYQKLEKNAVSRGLESALVSAIISKNAHKSIVCGDLNDIPSSYTYFKLRGSFKDVFLDNGFGIGSTLITKLPLLRIDYIFHSDQLKTLGYKKLKVPYSDHYPLLVNIGV